mmetsp:Transcript_124/g.145  ORF Transcript_124/g.145 Transcript_124/m.145 type:complete len:202 (-) Transcript_124:527-1132(-)|eukprot:CAMPEP_0119035208 /NCGR_PEP_ID=MMETSP1177-20130426/2153_1 /TAXON_ID=2985 /ORGANISM="Ochromonas sp, Strain CCMP1899" /LENGTH=201 /DNA_ID=CAMNT_0006993181 /DNA_START=128 /DNA_END=733 /DNA_ORIENTATION=+
MSSDWVETKAILSEVEQLFNRDDDIRYIYDVKKMAREIDSHSTNYLMETKDIIKKLTTRVTQKEAEIIAPNEDEHALKLEKLVGDREHVGTHLDTIRENTDNKRENISKMAAQALALKEKESEYALSSQIADSRTAYALSLYAKISNITWDYEAHPGNIKGCIGNDKTKILKNFSIDSRAKTSFEVSSELWRIIGEGVEMI